MAFLPIPPMLIPGIAAGAADELAEVRDAAVSAVDWVCQGANIGVLIPDQPVVADDWSLSGFGYPVGAGTPVGLAQGIALWLLDGRPTQVVGPGADLRGYDGLLVMGDGSAARSDKAPGHWNPEAEPFDAAVIQALETGDAPGLAGIDPVLAAEVGAAGAPAWVSLSSQVATVEDPMIDVRTDPFGVLYFVARWTVRWADPA